jgi:hypothetical protein
MGGLALLALTATTSIALGSSESAFAQESDASRAGGSLASFRSERELRAFLARLKAAQETTVAQGVPSAQVVPAPPPPPPPPPTATAEVAADSSSVVVTGSRVATPSLTSPSPVTTAPGNRKITNTQEEDVDEGGIVKAIGDKLVVLRRGRLFTIDTRGGNLRAIDHIDASPPGVNGSSDWYDEMLVKGDRIVVVGYSYGRGGTEVNRFRMSPDGRLRFEDAYHLRSNDYYSSRNYASRLIGNRLVYYTPLYLNNGGDDPWSAFPAVRRWSGDDDAAFKPIARPRRTYIVPAMRDAPEASIDTIHSVIDCDLTAAALKCDATAVIGPASRVFYVSSSAVYLWVSDAWHLGSRRRGGVRSFVYRLPLDPAEAPSAVAARGAPADQFSFREDRSNGLLDVLIRSDGGGDAMWNPEVSEGDVALLSIPFGTFGRGNREVPLSRYRDLPDVGENGWNFQNRFVGNHILYSGGTYDDDRPARLVAAGLRGGPVAVLHLPHAVSRIDQLGRDGVAIGPDRKSALNFSAIDLTRGLASVQDRFVMPAASEGESRSQAFFYRPDSPDGASGMLGLPISKAVDQRHSRLFGRAASILFLRRDQRRMSMAGELGPRVEGAIDDGCRASCVDWYGNARPVFWDRERVFALLGYELVEGRMTGNARIGEVARVNFAPQPRRAERR